ncbi:transposase [Streptomyces laculatispora]|uniref:Transposase n=1 Tax=Streptomyces laculatispora TaxID=887464 RepID=A0ABY9HYF0_9ACTN|nr:transposase [Streptomyces laculatispora]WLQ39089.1 transposase [Streptomyces laculatispora]
MICDGRGTPLKVITTAANVNDVTQTLALVDGIPPVAGRPGRPRRRPDALLGDKGYDSNAHRESCVTGGSCPSSPAREEIGLLVVRRAVEPTPVPAAAFLLGDGFLVPNSVASWMMRTSW